MLFFYIKKVLMCTARFFPNWITHNLAVQNHSALFFPNWTTHNLAVQNHSALRTLGIKLKNKK